jgi:HlyD family secretion protein
MNTDRPLEQSVIRKSQMKRSLQWLIAIVLAASIILWFVAWVSPSVQRSQIRTAKVERGDLEASITATGLVVPEFEQVISSPIDTRILRILKKAGDTIHPQEPILLLDLETAMLAYEKVNDQLALKVNQQHQLKATLENQLIKVNSQIKVKQLDLAAKKLKMEQNEPLYHSKYISKSDFDSIVLDYKSAQEQLHELIETKKNLESAEKLQQEGVDLEIKIYKSERTLLKQELELATTKAEKGGILTWVTLSEGATIRKGDVIAKVADLHTYRVDATISDIHANRLTIGMPVRVKINEKFLNGTVSNILPTIENGIVRAQITLEDKSNALLRSNMRVDVYVVTASKQKVLKVKKGLFASTEGKSEVFVIRNGKAVKTLITPGIFNFDYQEVVSGLAEGDEIIISDMSQYVHLKEVKVK